MKKYTNVQVGQRVEHSDLAFGLFESQRQNIQSLMNDLMVGSDSPTKSFVLSGFGASAVATTITVTRGSAIVGFRSSEAEFGMLLSDGAATRNIDIASLPDTGATLYGVYIRFNFEDSDYANRQFWNPLAVTPVETVRSVPTRKSENWSLAVELTSPGPEWLKIYDVAKSGSSLTLTDVRPLFFDSDATGGAMTDSDWGGGNDRNTNRGLYGVRGLYRFVKGTQRQLQDIIGDRWYSAIPSNIISMYAARKGIGFSPVYDSATPPVGDGVTNDSANLALAINNSTESVIDLGGKTYKLNAPVNITRSNITIRNGTIDMTGLTGGSDLYAFTFLGTEGSDVLVTGSVTGGVTNLDARTDLEIASTTGITAGDLLYVVSTSDFATGCKQGELHKVESVTDATDLVLGKPFLFSMAGTNNVRKITPIRNVKIEDITFLGAIPADPAHYRGAINAFRCENFMIRRCTFDGVYARAISFQRTYRAKVEDCEFKNSTKTDTGFGVDVLDGCFDIRIDECTSYNTRSLVSSSQTLGGINIGVHVAGSTHEGARAIASLNANTVGCSVVKSKVLASAQDGVYCLGDRLTITDCEIQSCLGDGVFFSAARTLNSASINMLTVTGCKVHDCFRGIRVQALTGAVLLSDVTISGNQIAGRAAGTSIEVRARSNQGATNLVISGNNLTSSGTMSEYLNLITEEPTSFLRGLVVKGNNIYGAGNVGVLVSNGGVFEDVTFANNTIRGVSQGAFFSNASTGVYNRVNFDSVVVANTGLTFDQSAGGVSIGCSFGGDLTGTAGRGMLYENRGNCDQIRLHGRSVGSTEGVRIINGTTGFTSTLAIDCQAQGVDVGLVLFHQASNTLRNLSIAGLMKATAAFSFGLNVQTTTSTSLIDGMDVDVVAEGDSSGMLCNFTGSVTNLSLKGSYRGSTDSGFKAIMGASAVIRYASFTGVFRGNLDGFRLAGPTEEASFHGVAKAINSAGFGFRCGKYIGTVNGYFSGGGTTVSSAALQNNGVGSLMTVSGYTSGGNHGVSNTDAGSTVLLVGVQSVGFGSAAHNGTISYGNAAAGHSLP